MARRHKPARERLLEYTIRLSRADIERLEARARAADCPPRQLARRLINEGRVTINPPPKIPEVNRPALAALRRVGGLINQLAKRAHLGQDVDVLEIKARFAEAGRVLTGLV